MTNGKVSVRYMVDDVDQAIDFYAKHFRFDAGHNASPAFAEVSRGNLRLLLAGPESSAGRPMPDGRKPEPGGWNRIHFVGRRHQRRGRATPRRRRQLPQRHRQRTRRSADPRSTTRPATRSRSSSRQAELRQRRVALGYLRPLT